jgi:hypothetical protein
LNPTKNVLVYFYAPCKLLIIIVIIVNIIIIIDVILLFVLYSVTSSSSSSSSSYFPSLGCGHCKKLTPQFKITCIATATEPFVTLAMLDGTPPEVSNLREKYNIDAYPKLVMFPEGSEKVPEFYVGPRKHREILAFVNEQAGTFRLPNGTLGNDAALVPSLDAIVTSAKTYDQTFLTVLEAAIEGLEQTGGQVKQSHQQSFRLYRLYAKKTVEKGNTYPQQETQRLTRLIENPTTNPIKVEEFTMKLNIVSKFLGVDYVQYSGKDGLVQALDQMIIAAAPMFDEAFALAIETAAADMSIDTTHYVMYAKKIAGNGEGYIEKEMKRLNGLLSSKSVLKHKKVNLQTRFNVLRQFHRLGEMKKEGDVEVEGRASEL